MDKCVIVSDAWAEAFDFNVKAIPNLNQLNYTYGIYLNNMLPSIRQCADVYHIGEGKKLMHTIDVSEDCVLNHVHEIDKVYEHYYICGFHLGRCTHTKAMSLAEHLGNYNNISVVYNLSMMYPPDKPSKILENSHQFELINYDKNVGFTSKGVPQTAHLKSLPIHLPTKYVLEGFFI